MRTVSSVAEILESGVPAVSEVDSDDLPVRWNGEPTKQALRQLTLESRVPGFDADEAALVLTGLWEGRTLRRLCATPGYPTRATVMGWAALVPKFAELLEAAQVGLGAECRDRAMENLRSRKADGAIARAWLATAAAYDRRIAKGPESEAPAVGVVVNLRTDFG